MSPLLWGSARAHTHTQGGQLNGAYCIWRLCYDHYSQSEPFEPVTTPRGSCFPALSLASGNPVSLGVSCSLPGVSCSLHPTVVGPGVWLLSLVFSSGLTTWQHVAGPHVMAECQHTVWRLNIQRALYIVSPFFPLQRTQGRPPLAVLTCAA